MYKKVFKSDEEELEWMDKRWDEIKEELKNPDLFPIERENLENELGELLDQYRRMRGHPAYYFGD